jgi:hypothetical protein
MGKFWTTPTGLVNFTDVFVGCGLVDSPQLVAQEVAATRPEPLAPIESSVHCLRNSYV